MGIPMQQKTSQRKQVRSVIEKVDGFEVDLQRLFEAVNQSSMTTNRRINELALIEEAVVELLGPENVDSKMKEISERKMLQSLESAKEALAVGLAKGDLIQVAAITGASLVVGREFDDKGEAVFPGRVQLQMSGIKPEFQEKLLGQAPGTMIDTNGGKFEVLEVYDVVQKVKTVQATDGDPLIAPEFKAPVAEDFGAANADTVAQLEAQLQPEAA